MQAGCDGSVIGREAGAPDRCGHRPLERPRVISFEAPTSYGRPYLALVRASPRAAGSADTRYHAQMTKLHVVSGVISIAASLLGQSASFAPKQIVSANTSGAFSIAVADLDGDGDLDVLSASEYDGKVAWHENIGSACFGAEHVLTGPGASARGARCVHAADLDGDGDVDVLSASFNDDKIAWYENLGGGVFGAQEVIHGAADGAWSVYAADLDSDGDVDVLSASAYDDTVAWYENLGAGTFGAKQVISASADFATDVRAADLDDDGDLDVLSASSYDDMVAWYENLGGGVFGAKQAITTDAYFARSVYAADLDNDGDQDVLSASQFDNKIAWYKNLGAGLFGAEQPVTTAAIGAWSVYAADVDDDGDLDVLSASGDDATIAWYPNDGSGGFGPQQVISSSSLSARCVYATDLDGDGDTDVLSASRSDHTIANYKNLQVHVVTSTATVYGSGCGDPEMVFTPTSTAVSGQTLTCEVVNTPTPVCMVSYGTSNTVMPGVAMLPYDLGIRGMAGCTLYQSGDILGLPTSTTGVATTVNFSLPVPASPQLICQHAYFQAFSYAPGVNARNAVASNGIDFLIGNQ